MWVYRLSAYICTPHTKKLNILVRGACDVSSRRAPHRPAGAPSNYFTSVVAAFVPLPPPFGSKEKKEGGGNTPPPLLPGGVVFLWGGLFLGPICSRGVSRFLLGSSKSRARWCFYTEGGSRRLETSSTFISS